MIKNITYENKEAIQNDPDLPERNMITDANMNEIKEVVNNNAQELQNEIKELEEDIKANAIIEETEKEKSLYIPDASGARGRLDVLGNVEQETSTQGKNYFTGNKIGSGTEKGLTYSFNNSILKVNGTTTASGNIILDAPIGVKLPAGTYTFTAKKITGDYTKPAGKDFALYLRDKDDFITGDYASSGITGTTLQNNSGIYSRQITITEETEIYFRFFVSSSDIVINNLELEIQVEPGSSYTEFEQFIPNSPSIDYPSPSKILGDNANEFDYENAEYVLGYMDTTTQKIVVSDSTRQHYFSYLQCNPNTTYTISKEIGKSFRVGTFSQKPAVGVAYNNTVANHTAKSITITTGENDNYIGFVCFSKESGDVGTYLDMYSTVKVEKGSIATSYSPYGQGSTEIIDSNKNIFNKNKVIKVGRYNSSGQFVATTTWRYFEFAPIPNTDYTIQVKNNFSSEVYFVGFSKDGTETLITSFNAKTVTFNAQNFTKIGYSVEENELDNCQLEKGNTATELVEHQEQNYILDIQEPMLKWDYFDLERKKKYM